MAHGCQVASGLRRRKGRKAHRLWFPYNQVGETVSIDEIRTIIHDKEQPIWIFSSTMSSLALYNIAFVFFDSTMSVNVDDSRLSMAA